MSYVVHLLITVNIFVLLAMSLDILVGFTGLLSIGHAVFFGIGAYATALLTPRGVSAWAALLAGMAVAALASVLVALPSVRVRGIYLLIITIAVQVVFTVVLFNWTELTGGAAGLPGIPPLSLFDVPLRGGAFLAVLTGLTLLWTVVLLRLVRSPFGRLLQALRDDETGCLSLGKNIAWAKIAVFALAGAGAAFAGSLYAHYTSYVDPRSFDISVSILVLLMVMLGGAGTLFGPMLGAIILTILPEVLKFVPLPPGVAAASRQLLYGLMLILVVFFRPQGLFGKRRHAHGA